MIRELDRKYANYSNIIALYHAPLYPSADPYYDPLATKLREAWLKIFDDYHFTTAFENHDHAYGRTKLLRNDKEDESGTLYIGDGAWGVDPTLPTKKWYHEMVAQTK